MPETPLYIAAKKGSITEVKRLLNEGADPNDTGDEPSLLTPLCVTKTLEMATELINANANVNAKDANGDTVLHYAVYNRTEISVIQLLLDKGADPNSKDDRGQVALELIKHSLFTPGFILSDPRNYAHKVVKILCPVTDPDDVEHIKRIIPKLVSLLNCVPSKEFVAPRISPPMTALNKVAKKQYGFETEFPHIEKNIGEYVYGRRGARRNTKRRTRIRKTKKRKQGFTQNGIQSAPK